MSAALPRPLEPWARVLALFPDELAIGLGAWLPRLAMAIGPLRARVEEGFDEPDGFDGLSRRGPYERLLPAEWALAQEFPEEFTRRAAAGEHAFFRLAFRSPAGQRRCLVLVDSGPSQLGTPRLAHLASLVVLERRAREANAEFLWGVLQQPPGRVLTGVNASAVEHWMRARCATEPTATDLFEWRLFFGSEKPEDELWLIGSDRVRKLSTASALVVHDSEASRLDIDIRPRNAPARQVQLQLPSNEICTRLIRDPLRREAPRKLGERPTSNLVFVAGGSRLLYLTGPETLAMHVMPGAPGTLVGGSQRVNLPRGEQLLAVGWDRGLVTVGQQGTAVHWNWYSKRALLRGQGAWHLHATDSHPAMTRPNELGACLPSSWFVTGRGDLVTTGDSRTYRVPALDVVAVAANKHRLVAVHRSEREAVIIAYPVLPPTPPQISPSIGPRRTTRVLMSLANGPIPVPFSANGRVVQEGNVYRVYDVGQRSPVVFGFDNLAHLGVIVAFGLSADRWRIVRLTPTPEVHDVTVSLRGNDARVIGAAQLGPMVSDGVGLIVVAGDGCSVGLQSDTGLRPLFRTRGRIVQSAVSPFSSHFAVQSEDGTLIGYSLRRQQTVLSLNLGPPS